MVNFALQATQFKHCSSVVDDDGNEETDCWLVDDDETFEAAATTAASLISTEPHGPSTGEQWLA